MALRRVFSNEETPIGRLQVGDMTIDFNRHRLLRHEEEIRPMPKAFDLLALLAAMPIAC